jgi:hypothetical protein
MSTFTANVRQESRVDTKADVMRRVFLATAALSAALAGCSAAPAQGSGNCNQQMATWFGHEGFAQGNAVLDAALLLAKDMTLTASTSAALVNARQLEHTGQIALSDLPPSCSGVTHSYSRALTDLAMSARDILAGNRPAGASLLGKGMEQLPVPLAALNSQQGG